MILQRALVATATVAALASCQNQSPERPADLYHEVSVQPSSSCAVRGDLTQKDDILCNLEFAYRYRDLGELARLTDSDFVFYFSLDDVGGNIPVQWDRTSELLATDKMFGSPPTGIRDGSASASAPSLAGIHNASWGFIKAAFQNATEPATSISLDIIYEPGDDSWLAFPPFYVKTAYYSIEVVAGEDTLRSEPGRQAAFTVHFTEVNGDNLWQLVEWRDLP